MQKGLASLERDGLIAGQLVGRIRLFQVDPRYFAAAQLRKLIARLISADRDLKARATELRRRPRRLPRHQPMDIRREEVTRRNRHQGGITATPEVPNGRLT